MKLIFIQYFFLIIAQGNVLHSTAYFKVVGFQLHRNEGCLTRAQRSLFNEI